MHVRLLIALCALVFTTACLESEEEITIRPDGSATVRLSATAGKADITDGYPIPLGGPWIPATRATEEWLRSVGSDTGSAAVRAALEKLASDSIVFVEGQKDPSVKLEVRGEFARVADLPATYAPAAEPYASAYLQRTTSFTTRHVGGRTVHVFERRFLARPFERYDVWTRMKLELDEGLVHSMSHEPQFTDEQRVSIARVACSAMAASLLAFASDALEPEYVDGDAVVAAGTAARIQALVSERVATIATEPKVLGLLDDIFPRSGGETRKDLDADLKKLELDLRDCVRTSITGVLAQAGTSEVARHRIERELERLFTACDHSTDLSDDNFQVSVHMPGTIVGGNAQSVSGSTATWRLSGEALHDRDLVLTAVSVVE